MKALAKKRYFKFILKIVLASLLVVLIYISTLLFPQFLFRYSTSKANLTIYSDTPIPEGFKTCIGSVMYRVRRSAFYDPSNSYNVFICNTPWRFYYFTTIKYKVGGLNYSFLNQNSFIRPCDMNNNRLYNPTNGMPILGDRTLAYFIAHEVTHGMTGKKVGRLRLWDEPLWKVEGYADYIGKGTIDFNNYLIKFKNHDREMDYNKSGLYCEYHLMVAYLFDVKGISQEDLFNQNIKEEDVRKELYQLKTRQKSITHDQFFAFY